MARHRPLVLLAALVLLPVPGMAAGDADDAAGIAPWADPLGEPPLRAPPAPARASDDGTPALGIPLVDALTQHDCDAGRDATPDAPVGLEAPASCTGYLGGSDVADAYAIDVPDATNVRATLTGSGSLRADACLDPRPSWHACGYVWPGAHADTLRGSFATGGRILLRVDADAGAGHYALALETAPWDLGPDCGSDADAPSQRASALPIATAACSGTLGPDDARDWLRFELPPGAAMRFGLAPNPYSDYGVCVASETPLQWIDCGDDYPPSTDEESIFLPQGGVYYALVHRLDGAGPYEVRFDPAAAQTDCGQPGDAGSRVRAADATLPLDCAGALDAAAGDAQDALLVHPDARGLRVHAALPPGAMLCAWPGGLDHGGRCEASAGGSAALSLLLEAPGPVALGVLHGPDAYAYRLVATTFTPPAQDDCGTGDDAPEDGSTATLAMPASCEGAVLADAGDLEDHYRVTLPASGLGRFRLESDAPDMRICVVVPYGATGSWQSCERVVHGVARVEGLLEQGDERLVFVDGAPASGPGAYRLTLDVVPIDDCGTGHDGADAPPDARPIAPGAPCQGDVARHQRDRQDWYSVDARAGDLLHARLDTTHPRASLCIARPDGHVHACTAPGQALAGLLHTVDEDGAWRVGVTQVYATAGPADYALTATVHRPPTTASPR